MADAFDRHMMGIALTMARRGLGRTAPNPSVGSVLVDPASGTVLARATTAPGGRPHAEPLAIGAAGSNARGATLYVTLEPCSHHGQTAPCAEAIVAAGIARVVCGIEDPDPRVAGRGLAHLRSAGIAVERGVRAAEAHDVTRGHITRVTQRRPFVQLKLALDRDGAVPRGAGAAPTFVTSPQARALGHLLRAEADAILVGHGTVVADDPELTCRLPGMLDRSPRRIVLARRGVDLAPTRLTTTLAAAPLTVFSAEGLMVDMARSMEAAGASVELVQCVGGEIWLPSVLERLAGGGITRLLVEGGPGVWHSFARAGLIDEVVLFKAGAADVPATAAWQAAQRDASRLLADIQFERADERRIGPDRMWRLHPAPSPPHRPTG